MPGIQSLLEKFYSLRSSDIMEKQYREMSVSTRDEPLINVLKILKAATHVWVVDSMESMKLVGVISDNQIMKALSSPELQTYEYTKRNLQCFYKNYFENAGGIMERKFVVCDSMETVGKLIIKMRKYHQRRIPLVERGKLVGEITIHSLVGKFLEMLIKSGGGENRRGTK